MLYPQNGGRIVTVDSVASFRPVYWLGSLLFSYVERQKFWTVPTLMMAVLTAACVCVCVCAATPFGCSISPLTVRTQLLPVCRRAPNFSLAYPKATFRRLQLVNRVVHGRRLASMTE